MAQTIPVYSVVVDYIPVIYNPPGFSYYPRHDRNIFKDHIHRKGKGGKETLSY